MPQKKTNEITAADQEPRSERITFHDHSWVIVTQSDDRTWGVEKHQGRPEAIAYEPQPEVISESGVSVDFSFGLVGVRRATDNGNPIFDSRFDTKDEAKIALEAYFFGPPYLS